MSSRDTLHTPKERVKAEADRLAPEFSEMKRAGLLARSAGLFSTLGTRLSALVT